MVDFNVIQFTVMPVRRNNDTVLLGAICDFSEMAVILLAGATNVEKF